MSKRGEPDNELAVLLRGWDMGDANEDARPFFRPRESDPKIGWARTDMANLCMAYEQLQRRHVTRGIMFTHEQPLQKPLPRMLRMLLMLEATWKGRMLELLQLHDCLLKVHLQNNLSKTWRIKKHHLRSKSCVGTHLLIMFANTQRGWGQSVLLQELHTEKELWSCL